MAGTAPSSIFRCKARRHWNCRWRRYACPSPFSAARSVPVIGRDRDGHGGGRLFRLCCHSRRQFPASSRVQRHSLFVIAALLGVWISPWFIPAAFLAHGLWDYAHHNRANLRLVSIPQWYIPWCVIIDVIVGIGLIVLWHRNGLL